MASVTSMKRSKKPPIRTEQPGVPSWVEDLQAWERAPYNGIKGRLPSWVPASLQAKFHRAQFALFSATEQGTATYAALKSDFNALVKTKYPKIVLALLKDERPLDVPLLILVDFYKAVPLGEERALAKLTDPAFAALVIKGKKYGRQQSKIAKKPRAWVGDLGQTISDIIGRLAQNKVATAKELWPHFFSELDQYDLNPKEVNHPTNRAQAKYLYDFKEGQKSITFGSFEKMVSLHRGGKKKLL